jgi:fructoselysine-6-P-deglycase FrlB-like protein
MLFLSVASAGADNSLGYPEGETHAVLIFLRSKAGASPDSVKAAAQLRRRGWFDVTISDAAPVSVDSLDSVHPHATASYHDALSDGFAALVFSNPVSSDDLTIR